MREYRHSINIVLAFLLFSGMAAGQDTSIKIITAAGETLVVSSIDSLTESTLYVTRAYNSASIPIDSLHSIILPGDTHFWLGAGIGLLVGSVSGFLIGYGGRTGTFLGALEGLAQGVGGVIIGGPLGFVFGGLIGTVSGSEEVVSLSGYGRTEKTMILQSLL